MHLRTIFCALIMLIATQVTVAQETVFSLFKSELKLADEYFERRDYQNALRLYKHVAKKKPSPEIELKIARTHHLLNQYDETVAVYEKSRTSSTLPLADLLFLAESLSGTSQYEAAMAAYEHYLAQSPSDELIMQKIWRLANVQYLYEDSALYQVQKLPVNSSSGDICPVPYQDGVVFMSNRKEVQPIEQLDAITHAPFFRLYYSSQSQDSSRNHAFYVAPPEAFDKDLKPRLHVGPVSFYDNYKRMVFAASTGYNVITGERTMQLHFADIIGGIWKVKTAFPHNSNEYSLADPTISADGKTLFFSGEMKGGFGGKDLYKSELVDGKWTKPENLGEIINTPGDEAYPFFYDGTLYFSSNGHPGLGGLDIFRAEQDDHFTDVQNVGYPLNTNYDDFGIALDSTGRRGYFSSNRSNGGLDDDIFQFDINIQSYPLSIEGTLKFKPQSWSDSLDLEVMPNATLQLIDNVRNIAVYETKTDSTGAFTLMVPHFSRYKIRVVGDEYDEHVVSLEIPKHRRSQGRHEIVIVKDAFRPD